MLSVGGDGGGEARSLVAGQRLREFSSTLWHCRLGESKNLSPSTSFCTTSGVQPMKALWNTDCSRLMSHNKDLLTYLLTWLTELRSNCTSRLKTGNFRDVLKWWQQRQLGNTAVASHKIQHNVNMKRDTNSKEGTLKNKQLYYIIPDTLKCTITNNRFNLFYLYPEGIRNNNTLTHIYLLCNRHL